ncbi:hypothetical protein K5Q02_23500 [Pseudomonas sp. MM211]|nr:hypothetical protein [Pseudomonas sp. MM211]UCJ16700.1 hypothetical protein K5Q02_23500 [Pseudomonas sp. MM211]
MTTKISVEALAWAIAKSCMRLLSFLTHRLNRPSTTLAVPLKAARVG